MRYEDIRQHVQAHFQKALRTVQEDVRSNGPFTGKRLDALRSSMELAGTDPENWADLIDLEGPDGLLGRFREARGIPDNLSAAENKLLLAEFHKGYLAFIASAKDHNASFDGYDLSRADHAPATAPAIVPAAGRIDDVIDSYLAEGAQVGSWTAKTLDEKRDALSLLSEVTDALHPAAFSKADARSVKELLLKLPKNRRKMPATRHLSAREAIKVQGMNTISPTTVNGYLSNFQSFFRWAVNNGYATDNPFSGVGVAVSSRTSSQDRKAFTADQLRTLENALLSVGQEHVQKPHHKWPALVAIYSGARLNEVAQMHKSDVRKIDGLWCFDFNEEMDKKLKTPAAARIVPVHNNLIQLGFLEFVYARRVQSSLRLYPEFSYCPRNGYGRNLGRWFNNSMLPSIGLDDTGLVFHSLRHSMVTLLGQADVEEPIIKTIVGHERTGVTQSHYFKAGYSLDQLQRAINKFSF